MVCDGCRRALAHVHISDAATRREWHLCGPCAPDEDELVHAMACDRLPQPPVWVCPACKVPAMRQARTAVRPADRPGDWTYAHDECGVPPGWEKVPGLVRVGRVAAATPEVAAQVGVPYEEPPPRARAAIDAARARAGKRPLFTDPCSCDLRNRAWDPHLGRCRTCGQPYYDPRHKNG